MFFALIAFAVGAQSPLRVAFLGTSITRGSGATERFLPIVEAGRETRYQTKVQTYGLCFGGAHSFTTLLLLKHTALPWKPDLVFVETGALDGFAPELSKPAIVQIFHELATPKIRAVFLARTVKCSVENTRQTILELGKIYNMPVASVDAATLPDGCHPNKEGHAQIAAAFLKALNDTYNFKPPRQPPPLPNAQFLAAARARLTGPIESDFCSVLRPVCLHKHRASSGNIW